MDDEMKITDYVHALRLPFQVTSPTGMVLERFVYVYLIVGKRICLIDCGVAGHEQLIFDYIRSLGQAPGDVSMIILTHSHPDHMGAALAVKQATGARLLAHGDEKEWIENIELQFEQRPVPGFHALVAGSVTVDATVAEGDIISPEDGVGLEVYHTPGHSAGSISLYLPADAALFCGDAVPVPGDIPIYEDVEHSLRSIEKLGSIPWVGHLFSAWDIPRQGQDVQTAIKGGIKYLDMIEDIVRRHPFRSTETLAWGQEIMEELGLPVQALNPLVIRSFVAHLTSTP